MKQTLFIVLQIEEMTEVFDYPKHLPIPSISDVVMYNGFNGKVIEIRHMTHGNVSEIKILCERI